mmetsp:Transcript_34804/g.68495  ORF Transcript_34804/g.68495 Transcript_34804/m.68495 type:complete len:128 (-) Transcript_34804:27-410(-)
MDRRASSRTSDEATEDTPSHVILKVETNAPWSFRVQNLRRTPHSEKMYHRVPTALRGSIGSVCDRGRPRLVYCVRAGPIVAGRNRNALHHGHRAPRVYAFRTGTRPPRRYFPPLPRAPRATTFRSAR